MPGILELQNADKGATSILEASKENKHYDAHQGIILCKHGDVSVQIRQAGSFGMAAASLRLLLFLWASAAPGP
jgi:hypothetical protein